MGPRWASPFSGLPLLGVNGTDQYVFFVVNGGGEDGFLLKANDLWQTRNHSIFLWYYLVLLFLVLVKFNVKRKLELVNMLHGC